MEICQGFSLARLTNHLRAEILQGKVAHADLPRSPLGSQVIMQLPPRFHTSTDIINCPFKIPARLPVGSMYHRMPLRPESFRANLRTLRELSQQTCSLLRRKVLEIDLPIT